MKQSSINYVIWKSFELNINLRTVFRRNDENNISVISRLWFKWILEGLPLGLTYLEINEIMDNDLVYDWYGNVDYLAILKTDLYSKLEMQEIEKKKHEWIQEEVKWRLTLDLKSGLANLKSTGPKDQVSEEEKLQDELKLK